MAVVMCMSERGRLITTSLQEIFHTGVTLKFPIFFSLSLEFPIIFLLSVMGRAGA